MSTQPVNLSDPNDPFGLPPESAAPQEPQPQTVQNAQGEWVLVTDTGSRYHTMAEVKKWCSGLMRFIERPAMISDITHFRGTPCKSA